MDNYFMNNIEKKLNDYNGSNKLDFYDKEFHFNQYREILENIELNKNNVFYAKNGVFKSTFTNYVQQRINSKSWEFYEKYKNCEFIFINDEIKTKMSNSNNLYELFIDDDKTLELIKIWDFYFNYFEYKAAWFCTSEKYDNMFESDSPKMNFWENFDECNKHFYNDFIKKFREINNKFDKKINFSKISFIYLIYDFKEFEFEYIKEFYFSLEESELNDFIILKENKIPLIMDNFREFNYLKYFNFISEKILRWINKKRNNKTIDKFAKLFLNIKELIHNHYYFLNEENKLIEKNKPFEKLGANINELLTKFRIENNDEKYFFVLRIFLLNFEIKQETNKYTRRKKEIYVNNFLYKFLLSDDTTTLRNFYEIIYDWRNFIDKEYFHFENILEKEYIWIILKLNQILFKTQQLNAKILIEYIEEIYHNNITKFEKFIDKWIKFWLDFDWSKNKLAEILDVWNKSEFFKNKIYLLQKLNDNFFTEKSKKQNYSDFNTSKKFINLEYFYLIFLIYHSDSMNIVVMYDDPSINMDFGSLNKFNKNIRDIIDSFPKKKIRFNFFTYKFTLIKNLNYILWNSYGANKNKSKKKEIEFIHIQNNCLYEERKNDQFFSKKEKLFINKQIIPENILKGMNENNFHEYLITNLIIIRNFIEIYKEFWGEKHKNISKRINSLFHYNNNKIYLLTDVYDLVKNFFNSELNFKDIGSDHFDEDELVINYFDGTFYQYVVLKKDAFLVKYAYYDEQEMKESINEQKLLDYIEGKLNLALFIRLSFMKYPFLKKLETNIEEWWKNNFLHLSSTIFDEIIEYSLEELIDAAIEIGNQIYEKENPSQKKEEKCQKIK